MRNLSGRRGVDSRFIALGLAFTLERYPIDPREINVNELEVLGSRSGGRENTLQAIQLVASGKVRPLIGDVIRLSEANAGLEKLREGRVFGK